MSVTPKHHVLDRFYLSGATGTVAGINSFEWASNQSAVFLVFLPNLDKAVLLNKILI